MIMNYSNFEKTPTNVVVIDTEKDSTTDYVRVVTLDPNRYMRLPAAVGTLLDELLLPMDATLVLKANDGVLFDCDHKTVPITTPYQQ